MMKVTISFFGPSFNYLSLTLEQKIPITTTGTMLQDSNITTTGKLVFCIAKSENIEAATRAEEVITQFFVGIMTLSLMK